MGDWGVKVTTVVIRNPVTWRVINKSRISHATCQTDNSEHKSSLFGFLDRSQIQTTGPESYFRATLPRSSCRDYSFVGD